MKGRKAVPAALSGRPGPPLPAARPTCPAHLSPTAKAEWKRLAPSLGRIGLLTPLDRAALAAYCAAWGRWVEAERRLAETPPILKTPSGYVQASPWIAIAGRQLELMARFMAELGLTPSARARLTPHRPARQAAREPPDPGASSAEDQDIT